MALPNFAHFEVNADVDVAVRWRKWLNRFENMLTALTIDDPARMKALLLHYMGEDVYDIYETLHIPAPGDGQTVYTVVKTALTAHFCPATNAEFEIYKFRQAVQEKGENLATFHTRLLKLASTCEFGNKAREVKSQIIVGCSDSKLRRKALSDPTLTLQKILELGRAMEISEEQGAEIERHSVNAIRKSRAFQASTPPASKASAPPASRPKKSTCYCCGKVWPHKGGKKQCPAFGHKCTKCEKLHHFETLCKSTDQPASTPTTTARPRRRFHKKHSTVNMISEQDGGQTKDSDEYVFHVHSTIKTANLPRFQLTVGSHKMSLLADSGSTVNLLSKQDWLQMSPRPTLTTTDTQIFPYGASSPLCVVGKFHTVVSSDAAETDALFYVVTELDSLLSWKTAQDLNLIRVVQAVGNNPGHIDSLVCEYNDLFHGLGKLKDVQIHLHVDKTVQPVAQRYRRVSFHICKDLEEQIRKDEENDVIEDAKGPTPWVSPVVVVPKRGNKVRVCIDMREANRAIQRERHSTLTIIKIIHDLNGAKVFSKLDLN